MAHYRDEKLLKKSTSAEFDKIHEPGAPAPHAGIYCCVACKHEIAIAETHKLPPQNHHQHATGVGRIQWQLTVYADHEAK